MNLLAARRELHLPSSVPGDVDTLAPRYAFRPIVTAERYSLIGNIVYDEIAGELAFNITPGFLLDGPPMLLQLSQATFYNASSGQVLEFSNDCQVVTFKAAGEIRGVAASRLYRMLTETVVKDRQRWKRAFPDNSSGK